MAFWKKKDKSAIPLPPSEVASQPSASSSSRDPNAARNELFGSSKPSSGGVPRAHSPSPSYATSDPYASRNAGGTSSYQSDPYSNRKPPAAPRDTENDPMRAALFSGYNPDKLPKQEERRTYDCGGYNPDGGQGGQGGGVGGSMTQEEEDEDVEMIKRDMRSVKQETLGSARNALRIAREAEETARTTLGKLGDQSERIANTERHLDLAKASSSRADDKTKELKTLNRSIFLPAVTWNKEGKRIAEERRITDRHIEETADRQKAMLDVQQTQQRLNDRSLNPSSRGQSAAALAARKEGRSKYQFEATASDDELEDELDDDLNETLDVTKRLKALAVASGEEINRHNERLVRINDKAEGLDLKILHNVARLKKIN